MIGNNDWLDYLAHSFKGTTWGDHKYIAIKNGRYIYPEDKKTTSRYKWSARKSVPTYYNRNARDSERRNAQRQSSQNRAATNLRVEQQKRARAAEQAKAQQSTGSKNLFDQMGRKITSGVNAAGNALNNAGKAVANTAQNAGKAVANTAQNVGNAASNAKNAAENWIDKNITGHDARIMRDRNNTQGDHYKALAANDRKYHADPTYYDELAKASYKRAEPYEDSYNNSLAGRVEGAVNAASNAVSNIPSAVSNAVENAARTVGGAVNDARDAAGNAVQNVGNAVSGAAQNAGNAISNTVGNAASAARNLFDEGGRRIGEAAQNAGNALSNIPSTVSNAVQNIPDQIAEASGVNARRDLNEAISNENSSRFDRDRARTSYANTTDENLGAIVDIYKDTAKEYKRLQRAAEAYGDPAAASQYEWDAYQAAAQAALNKNMMTDGTHEQYGQTYTDRAADHRRAQMDLLNAQNAYSSTPLGQIQSTLNNLGIAPEAIENYLRRWR